MDESFRLRNGEKYVVCEDEMAERILELACGITGVSDAENSLLEALCHAAETAWMSRLKSGITAEDCGEAFLCAVAFTAAADYVVSRGGDDVASFTAGEISIRKKGGSDGETQANALRKTAERLMVPYAVAENFAFKGVRG